MLDKSLVAEKQGSQTCGLQVAPVGMKFATPPRWAGLLHLYSLSEASQGPSTDSHSRRVDSLSGGVLEF